MISLQILIITLFFIINSFAIEFSRDDYPNFDLPNNDVAVNYAQDLFSGLLPFPYALNDCNAASFTENTYRKYYCDENNLIVRESYTDAACTGNPSQTGSWNNSYLIANWAILFSTGNNAETAVGMGYVPNIPFKYACSNLNHYTRIALSIQDCETTTVFREVSAAVGNDACVLARVGTSRVFCSDNGNGNYVAQLQYFNVSGLDLLDTTTGVVNCSAEWYTLYAATETCDLMFNVDPTLPVYGKVLNCTLTSQGENPDADSAASLSLFGAIAVSFAFMLL